jgi:dCTP deaminase
VYLSDRDLRLALAAGLLIVNPPPEEIDTTSIDLHLDRIDQAKVWDVRAYEQQEEDAGRTRPALGLGRFDYRQFATTFAIPIPTRSQAPSGARVFRDGDRVILEPQGFFLWQTAEEVGTPEVDPRLICFVDGKSGRARTGIVVHMTAPTIHAGWWGKVTLEIANLGPFRLALQEGDAIAQIVVASITSPPTQKKSAGGIALGQQSVTGTGPAKARRGSRRGRQPKE